MRSVYTINRRSGGGNGTSNGNSNNTNNSNNPLNNVNDKKKYIRSSSLQSSRSSTILSIVSTIIIILIYYINYNRQQQQQQQQEHQQKLLQDKVQQQYHSTLRASNNNNNDNVPQQQSKEKTYQYFKNLAMDIAKLQPLDVFTYLETNDPFGVRTFEKKLLQKESEIGTILDYDTVKSIFISTIVNSNNTTTTTSSSSSTGSCPIDRITLPDQRNLTKSKLFRQYTQHVRDNQHNQDLNNNDNEYIFLFFQHLRKAGGTNFCTLGQNNLPKYTVPHYYCMPDWFWIHKDGKKAIGAGYLMHWSNNEIINNMKKKQHLIIGNEWDNFNNQQHFQLPAILTTSFRKPLHRALSQYRFECIEDRGCTIKNPVTYWNSYKNLHNVYTTTFATIDTTTNYQNYLSTIHKTFNGTTDNDKLQRSLLIGTALDTIIQFHLILNMEWLAYSKKLVIETLGFTNVTALTHRIRPFINQHERTDTSDINKLGVSDIGKSSWLPENYLSNEQYKQYQTYLALDEILTDTARRIFLERLFCTDLDY